MYLNTEQQKKHHKTLINVARSQLALDEATYRTMLGGATGKQSLREMNLPELMKVLELLKQKGFKVASKAGKSRRKSPSMTSGHRYPVVDKIVAIWLTMARHGIVTDGSERALDAYVRRMTLRCRGQGVESVRFLTANTAPAVLESLKQWHRRELVTRLRARGYHIPTSDRGQLLQYDEICALFAEAYPELSV
ncbi:regulatory protein GemA [Shewanella algae]|uniref:gp16 family protein n=1 Tax=Shewanella algae TaxID=38313 RepID=UPI0031F5ADD8